MSAAIDLSELRSLEELLGPEDVADLVELYLSDSLGRVSEIEAQVRGRDANGIRRAAHTLKGSSLNLGLTAVATACASLEDSADDPTAAGERLAVLQRAGTETRGALEAELERLRT